MFSVIRRATAGMSSRLTSDLCKPLPLVLIDQSRTSMLDYFIQFMENEKALHLVQFWLSVEAFKTTPLLSCDPMTPGGCVRSVECEGGLTSAVMTTKGVSYKMLC